MVEIRSSSVKEVTFPVNTSLVKTDCEALMRQVEEFLLSR